MMYECKVCSELKSSKDISQIDDICFDCKIAMLEEAMGEFQQMMIGKDYR